MKKGVHPEDLVPMNFELVTDAEGIGRSETRLELCRNQWNCSGGVTVIYDSSGRPWLRQECLSAEEQDLLNLPPPNPTIRVPHSEDDGRWARQNLTF